MPIDREYRIKISTTAEASGAEAMRASVEGVGKESEKAEGHVHALHKVFHALNEVVPGLGILMQAAFSPVGAAVGVAVMALRYFHEKLAEVNEELKKMEEEAAKPFAEFEKAQWEALDTLAVSEEHYRQWREHLHDHHNQISEDLDHLLAKYKGQEQAIKNVADAEHAAERSKVEASGLPEGEKQSKLAALDAAHEKAADEAERAAKQKELAAMGEAVSKAQQERDDAEKAAAAAHQKANTFRNEVQKSTLPQEITDAEERLKKAKSDQAAFELWKKEMHPFDIIGRHGNWWSSTDRAYGDIVSGNDISRAKAELNALRARQLQASTTEETTKANEAQTQKKAEEAQAQTKSLEEKLKDLQAARKAEEEARPTIEREKEFRRRLTLPEGGADRGDDVRNAGRTLRREQDYSGPVSEADKANAQAVAEKMVTKTAAQDIESAEEVARQIKEHKDVSEQNRQNLLDVAAGIAGHRVTLQQAVAMMEAANGNMATFVNDTFRLATAMSGMINNTNVLSSRVTVLTQQVAQLQQQLRATHN